MESGCPFVNNMAIVYTRVKKGGEKEIQNEMVVDESMNSCELICMYCGV